MMRTAQKTGGSSENILYRRKSTAAVLQHSLLHTYAIRYSLLLLRYKSVQHVTVLYVGDCNTVVSILLLLIVGRVAQSV
jgi:hypothetical protein